MNLPDHAVEMGGRPADVAVSLLNSFNPVADEVLVTQWVIAGSGKVKMPESEDNRVQPTDFSVFKALMGKTEASRDEKTSRRSKVDSEPNFIACLRIAARSKHRDRSAALAHSVIMSIKASDGPKGNAHHAIARSNVKCARTTGQIDADQKARRFIETKGKVHPDIGDEPVIGGWKDDI